MSYIKMWVVVVSGQGVDAGVSSQAYRQKRSAMRLCKRQQAFHERSQHLYQPTVFYRVDWVLVPQTVVG